MPLLVNRISEPRVISTHRVLVLLLLIFVGLICVTPAKATQKNEQAICPKQSPNTTTLYLPLIFQFEDSSLNQASIFATLDPVLGVKSRFPSEYEMPQYTQFDPVNGWLEMAFCLQNWRNKADYRALALLLGPKLFALELKPSKLSQLHNPAQKIIKSATELLIGQPSPDWLIVMREQLSQTTDDSYLLAFDLFNPNKKGAFSPKVTLMIASKPTSDWNCVKSGLPQYSTVELDVKKSASVGKSWRVLSKKDDFKEISIEPVAVAVDACTGESSMTVPLGYLIPIESEHVSRVKYKLSKRHLVKRLQLVVGFETVKVYPELIPLTADKDFQALRRRIYVHKRFQ